MSEAARTTKTAAAEDGAPSGAALPAGQDRIIADGPPLAPGQLVAAYEAVLGTVRDLTSVDPSATDPPLSTWGLLRARIRHLVVWVASMHLPRGASYRLRRLPRARPLLHLFTAEHIRWVLSRIQRRLLARAAAGHDDASQREAVERYLQSLPPSRRTAQVTALVVTTFVVLRLALLAVPGAARSFGGTGTGTEAAMVSRLLTALEQVARDISSLQGLIDELSMAPWSTIAFVATSVATVLWLELRLFVPAFRLHRALWNLHGTAIDVAGPAVSGAERPVAIRVRDVPASWHVQRAEGLYEAERGVLRGLGAAPPKEPAFDLVVSALALPSLMYLTGLLMQAGQANRVLDASEPLFSYTLAAGVAFGVAARAWWLVRAWMRRQGTRRAAVGDEVLITGTRLVVTCRSPHALAIGSLAAAACSAGVAVSTAAASEASLAIAMAGLGEASPPVTVFAATRFLVTLLVIAPLWVAVTRDVAAHLAVRDDRRWQVRAHPMVATAAIVAGGLLTSITQVGVLVVLGVTLVAWSVHRTTSLVHEMSGRARTPGHLPLPSPGVVVGAFLLAFPLALAMLQRALNDVWVRDGRPLDDDAPADPAGSLDA